MPPLAAAVAAYFAVSVATAYVLIAVAVVTLASVAYSAYMMASMEKPSSQSDATKRLQTIRSSIQPHRVIYGECMTGGVLVYAQSHSIDPFTGETVDGDNVFISLLVAFCAHEVAEIKEIWLNDKISSDISFVRHIPVTPEEGYWLNTPDGTEFGQNDWVVTRPAVAAHDESWVHVSKYTGTLAQVADPLLLSLPPVPTTIVSKHPATGLSDLTASGEYSVEGMDVFSISIMSTGATDRFRWHNTDNSAFGEADMTGADQLLAYGISIKFAAITGHSLGQSWEVRAFDGAPWTSDCTLTNRTYAVVTLRKNDTAFPTGLPNVKALIRGNNQIYDPATTLTGYSDNWALCVRDYLTKPYGLNAPAEDINNTVAIAARNACEELVTLADGSTQKRYTVNGSFTVDKTPVAIMSELLASAYGAITWTQGQYRILPAVYYTPDLTFHGMNAAVPGLTESDLRGAITVRPLPSIKDKFNTVKGTYISPETWQPVDFPTVTNALYVSEDGGELVKDIQLSYVTDSTRAQRIAKILLEKSRQSIAVDFPAKWSAFPLAVGDNVPISIAHLGWVQKIFTVRDWRMNSEGGVDLALQEDASGCYAWNNGEETTIDLAQNTILPEARYVASPRNLTANVRRIDTNSGTATRMDLYLVWTPGDERPVRYQVQYQDPINESWFSLPDTVDTVAQISGLYAGTYNIRVRAINALGAESEWATVSQYIPLPDTTVPDVTGLEIVGQGNNYQFVGRDIALGWNYVSPRADTDVSGPGRGSSWFRYYVIEVYTTGDVLRRTDYTTHERYTYTYEMNRQDGSGTAIRNVKFSVRIMSSWGDVSDTPAVLTATNPNIAKLSSLALSGGVKSLSVQLPAITEPDFAGYDLYASQTTGFTPGAGNKINSGGPETVVTKLGLAPGIWYVRAAGRDTFGSDGANFSDEYSATVSSDRVTPSMLDAAARVDFFVRDTILYFNVAVLTWDAGYIDRGAHSYTLAAGTLADANSSYIVATFNDTGYTATLSKTAVSSGIPTLTDQQAIIAVTSGDVTPQGNYYCYVRQGNSMAIEGALIRNLSVTSLKIEDNAVTVPIAEYTDDIVRSSGTTVLVQQADITTEGEPVLVMTSFNYHPDAGSNFHVKITRYDTIALISTVIYETSTINNPTSNSQNFSAQMKDDPVAGTYTYQVEMYFDVVFGSKVSQRSLVLIGVKK